MKKLVIDTENYILDYCKINNYKISINYILNIKYLSNIADEDILVFKINYNKYNYLYKLKLNNHKIIFSVILKHNIKKQIILRDKHDFNILIKSMINDIKEK